MSLRLGHSRRPAFTDVAQDISHLLGPGGEGGRTPRAALSRQSIRVVCPVVGDVEESLLGFFWLGVT